MSQKQDSAASETTPSIPTMETIDLSVDRLRAMLESMVEEKDPGLIDLLVANLSSFVGIMLNWKKKDLMQLLSERILREEEALWHEENRKKKIMAKKKKPSKEESIKALMAMIGASSSVEEETKVEDKTVQMDNVLEIFESREFRLPRIVTEGSAYVAAFRALMIGSAKRINALLPKNGENSGQSTTQEYLVTCDQVISRVIEEASLFAEKAYGVDNLGKCEASSLIFSVVKQAILDNELFAELFCFKEDLEFTPIQLDKFRKEWKLSSSDDDNSVSETPTTKSISKKDKQARIALLVISLREAGASEMEASKMARSVEKLARDGVSFDEVFRRKAVRCQIEGNLKSTQIYVKAAGLEEKKLAKLVAKEVTKKQELAKTQAVQAAQKKATIQGISVKPSKEERSGKGKKGKGKKNNK